MEQLITEGCRGLREAYSFFISYFSFVCWGYHILRALNVSSALFVFSFFFLFSQGEGVVLK